jgi:hypothetical protein
MAAMRCEADGGAKQLAGSATSGHSRARNATLGMTSHPNATAALIGSGPSWQVADLGLRSDALAVVDGCGG